MRLAQCYHPVALWAFREYCLEVEVDCDARGGRRRPAIAGADRCSAIYQSADRRDGAARAALRKRVDVLMAGGPQDAALPAPTIAAATLVMGLVLPWIV